MFMQVDQVAMLCKEDLMQYQLANTPHAGTQQE
jgi:hypothetical protein